QPRPGGGALHGRRGAGDEGRRGGRAGERGADPGAAAAGLHEEVAGGDSEGVSGGAVIGPGWMGGSYHQSENVLVGPSNFMKPFFSRSMPTIPRYGSLAN